MRRSLPLLALACVLLTAAGPSDTPPAKPGKDETLRTTSSLPSPPAPPRVKAVPPPMPPAYNDSSRIPKYTPKPAIWQFADKDTTVTLFGSVHAMDHRLTWRTPLFDGIVKAADRVVFETTADGQRDVEDRLDDLMPRLFHYNRPKLIDRVSPDNRDELKRLLTNGRIPRYMLNGLPSYFAQGSLLPASRVGRSVFASRDSGVETILRREVKAAGKPLLGLEDGAEAYVSLYMWDEKAQDKALNDALTALRTGQQSQTPYRAVGPFGELEFKWVTGQMTAASLADYMQSEPRQAMEAVFDNRNAKWVPQLVKMLETPGRVLVIAGSGHFFGTNTVLDLLAKRGIRPVRIQ